MLWWKKGYLDSHKLKSLSDWLTCIWHPLSNQIPFFFPSYPEPAIGFINLMKILHPSLPLLTLSLALIYIFKLNSFFLAHLRGKHKVTKCPSCLLNIRIFWFQSQIPIPTTSTHHLLGAVIYCVWFLVVLSQRPLKCYLIPCSENIALRQAVLYFPYYLPVFRKDEYCIVKINITGKGEIKMVFIEYSLQLVRYLALVCHNMYYIN